MESDAEIKENEETQETVEETSPASEALKMQTFTRLPGGVDESDSEKMTRIISLLDQVCSKLGDEDDNRASYDTMMQSFNSLKAKTENMIHKLDNEVDYTRSLEEKLKRKNVELDNIQLRKALLEEQGRMTLALEDFQKKMDETLNSITNSFTSIDKNISDNCTLLQQKADAIKDLKDQIDDIIVDYNKSLYKGANDQYTLLKNDCKEVLTDCNNRVGEIKDSVLSFLKTCNEQNLELIKKIPEQKRKFSWLDVVVYAMCGVCIIGMVVQMVG